LAERLIGLESGDEKGPETAGHFSSGARMYQTKSQLSTAGGRRLSPAAGAGSSKPAVLAAAKPLKT
jgi:hypothetical protein